MVSNTNSTGLANTPQHVVREAQQQCIARPGPQQAYANLAIDQSYLASPSATPLTQSFDQQWCDGVTVLNDMPMSFAMYNGVMNVAIKKNQDGYPTSDFEAFIPSNMSTPTIMDFPDNPIGTSGWMSESESAHSRTSSRRISNGIMDRVNKFEHMSHEPLHTPPTPPTHNEIGRIPLRSLQLIRQLINHSDYLPPTPMDTPQGRPFKHIQPPQRFTEGYDESNEETVKPPRQRVNRRSQTVFDEMRQATEALTIMPEVRRANTMPTVEAINPTSTSTPDYLGIDTTGDGFQGPSYPLSASSEFSHHMSPATPNMGEFEGFDFNKSQVGAQAVSTDMLHDNTIPCSIQKPLNRASQHRRTESVASLASAASIASIDIESTKTTTGITIDDIQQYIEGPDPKDNKWICTFEDCNKKFGRKENIKSHVQTHLNDRQYQCPACQKCFVRQHDLKRHAKIHTGIKPYPCACGNSFARHDALTRHRQRGMCIGAFEGSAPKNANAGVPVSRDPITRSAERRQLGPAERTSQSHQCRHKALVPTLRRPHPPKTTTISI